jgi:hypothetical protein
VIDALILGFEWTWDPGFRGILTVALASTILLGSVWLIVATNTGSRLGLLIALTGFCGWMTVMGVVWSMYGIGWKGKTPSWEVVDVVRSEPGSGAVDSRIDVARSLPLPEELEAEFGTPVEVRDASDVLSAQFPPDQRDPTWGDLASADQQLREEIDDSVAPWRILETSNKYTGETQASVSAALGPEGKGFFESSADYVVIDSYLTGGKAPREDDGILARAQYKVTRTLDVNPDTFYAVVQLQPVIPQEVKPGQAPPTPVRDEAAPIYSVVLQRVDSGLLRRPQMMMTLFMGTVTAVLCWMLHRRDKLAQAQRAAAGAA